MRLTLNLDKNQAAILQDTLTTTLQSLVLEETMCMEALENRNVEGEPAEEEQKAFNNINKHLSSIQPQRVLLAEILHNLVEANKESKIITDIRGIGNIPRNIQ